MENPKRPVNSHKAYHAHVYFDEQSTQQARFLCDQSAERFQLKVGRFHERLVGPHTRWSCQISFGKKDFDRYIEWLEENRQGLTIFIHPLSGDHLLDHTEFAYWLGDAVDLDLAVFDDMQDAAD